MKLILTSCLLLLLILLASSSRNSRAFADLPETGENSGPRQVEPPARQMDACGLLTASEIRAVQGHPVAEVKPSVKSAGSFVLSECLYRSVNFSKSVHLVLAVPGPAKSAQLGPRQFWEKQFHLSPNSPQSEPEISGARSSSTGDPDREPDVEKPHPVTGLGEQAYWVGHPILGALYVLRGDTFIRISVGGETVERARLRKSKTLAEIALRRLQSESIRP